MHASANHRCLLNPFFQTPCNSMLEQQQGHAYLGSCSAGSLVYTCLCLAVGCVNARLGCLLTLHATNPSDVHDFTMHCALLCRTAMRTEQKKTHEPRAPTSCPTCLAEPTSTISADLDILHIIILMS